MVGREDVNIIESSKSKLDAIMNVLNALTIKTIKIYGFFVRFHSNTRYIIVQLVVQPSSKTSKSKEVAIATIEA